jgi:hypothetical protein
MSMNATCDAASEPAMRRATVDFPEPEPPAIPTINDTRRLRREGDKVIDDPQGAGGDAGMGAFGLSQLGIDEVKWLFAMQARPLQEGRQRALPCSRGGR